MKTLMTTLFAKRSAHAASTFSRLFLSIFMLLAMLLPTAVWAESVTFTGTEKFYFNGWQRENDNCWNFCVSSACLKVRFCNGSYEGGVITGNRISDDENGIYEVTAPAGTWDKVQVCRYSSDCNNWWTGGRKEDLQSGKNYLHGTLNQGTVFETYGSTSGDTPAADGCTFKNGTTIYLNLNGCDWTTDGGKPAAMFYYVDNANKNYGNNSTSWGGEMTGSTQIGSGNYVLATQVSGDYWKVTVPADNLAYVRFVRIQASNAEWTWNCQKNKLSLADMGTNNCVKLGGWDANATWTNYGSGSAVEKVCPATEPTLTESSFRGDMWLNDEGAWLGGSDALAPHFADNGDGTATLKFVFPDAQCRLTLYHDGGDKTSDRCDGATNITKTNFESSKYYFAATGATKLYTFTLNTSTGRFTTKAEAYPVQKTGWHVYVSVGDETPTEVGTITEEEGLVIENLAAGSHNMYITDGSANPIWGVNKFGGLYIDKTNSDVAWATQRVYYDAGKFSATEFPIRGTKDATGRFKLDAASDVRIAFDGGKITINKVAAPEPAEELTGNWFIMGGHNGWSNNNPEHQMTISAGEATKTYYNVTSQFDFKVYGNGLEHGWSYYSQSKSDVTCTEVPATISNINLPTITAPTDVTIHYDGRNVWVTTEQHKTFGTNYALAGDFNSWNNTALPLTKINDYTATITQRFTPGKHGSYCSADEGQTKRVKITNSDWSKQIKDVDIDAATSNFTTGTDCESYDGRILIKVTQPTDVTFTIWKNSSDQMKVSIKAVPVQMQSVKFYDGDTEYTDKAQSVEAGQKPTAPVAPTKAGYKFMGWSETNGGEVVDVTTITINADKNFYAKWEVATLENATLNKTSLTLYIGGESETLVGGATPVGVSVTGEWSVSPAGVVTVVDGVVAPQATGNATITYTVTDNFGNTASATCAVSVQACQMTTGTRQNSEYNAAGMFNNATVKLKFQSEYYMHVKDGAPKMLQSEASTAEWREIPTGETFSPAWTNNEYPLFYLKHVETGKYLCRGNGQYGANGDWFYYVTTVVDEPTGNDCLWFYDTTLGHHLVCREGAGSQLKKSFMISNCNIDGAGNTFDQHGAKPQVVCHYAPDPSGNVWTKLATVAWTRSTNPDDAGMTFAEDTHRFISEGSFTQAATSLSGAEIYYVSSNPAVATVNPTTGEVTPLTKGQTSIKATLAADGCYNGDSKSYTLTLFDGYYVASNIGDNPWASDQYKMTDGAYTFTALAANTEHKFKVTTGFWKGNGGLEYAYNELSDPRKDKAFYKDNYDNICFKLKEAADVTIRINEGVITIETSAALLDPKCELVGGIGGDFVGHEMTVSEDGLTCSYTMDLGNNDQYNFQIHDLHIDKWLGQNTSTGMNRNNCIGWILYATTYKCWMRTDMNGTYTFIYEYSTQKISIDYPLSLQEVVDAAAVGSTVVLDQDYSTDLEINKTITIDAQDHSIGNLTVTTGGNLTLTSGLTVNNFYLQANGASHTSGQILNPENLTVQAEAYFDLTLENEHIQFGWYDFCVPFAVDVMSGITGIDHDTKVENTTFTNEVDYAVMEHQGALQAQGQYPYKKFRGTMEPSRLYSITLDDEANFTTVRFRKAAGTALVSGNSVTLGSYAGASEHANWNGVGNGTLRHADAGVSVEYVQVYNTGDKTFSAKRADNVSLVVGTAVMVQQDGGTMTLDNATHSTLLAPARAAAEVSETYAIELRQEATQKADRLFYAASEEAEGAYTIGRDLMKAGNIGNVQVPQLWINAYGQKLCVHEAEIVNLRAESSLSLYAPAAGEYTLEITALPDSENELYLTENGRPIWNLTMAPITLDLERGTNSQFGLRLFAKPITTVTTDLQGAQLQGAETFKYIDNGILYLRTNGRTVDATGRVVR